MPFVKCSSCGHRNSQSAEVCANCDAVLHSWIEGSASKSAVNMSAAPRQQEDGGVPIPEKIPAEKRAARPIIESQVVEKPVELRGTKKSRISGTAEKSIVIRAAEQPIVTRVTRNALTSQITEEEFPYQTQLSNTALELYSASEFTQDSTTEKTKQDLAEAEAWQMRRFPFNLPGIKPALAGTVIQIETREQSIYHNTDLLSAVLSLLAEVIWSVPNVRSSSGGPNDSDRVTITRIRLRTTNQEIKDAQLRGDPKGANLAMGDVISLWGRKSKGVLTITRGYDHTSKSNIGRSGKREMMLPALIVVALILVAFYFSPSWTHIPFHIHMNNVDIPSLLKNIGSFFAPKR